MERKQIPMDKLADVLELIAAKIREKKRLDGIALINHEFIDIRGLWPRWLEVSFCINAHDHLGLCQAAIAEISPELLEQPPDDFMTKEIQYTAGHKCVPNGVGDYDFICPTTGRKPGFVPFF